MKSKLMRFCYHMPGDISKVRLASVQLRRRSRRLDTGELLRELDGLPLALAHAGSYLSRNTMSVRKYLDKYHATFLSLMQSQWRSTFDDSQRSIATTWKLSCDSVEKEAKAAGTLLRLWGFLDHNDVFFALFSGLEMKTVDKVPRNIPRLGELLINEDTFDDAMILLVAYSLASPVEGEGFYMHRVQHRWIQHGLVTPEHRAALNSVSIMAVSTAINKASTDDEENRLLPHAQHQAHVLERSLLRSHVHVLHRIAAFLDDHKIIQESKYLYNLVREVLDSMHGAQDDRTLRVENKIAKQEAEASGKGGRQESVDSVLDKLPYPRRDDPEAIINDTYNRAQIYLKFSDLEAAEQYFNIAVMTCLRSYGMADQKTLHIADLHGVVLARLGAFSQAAAILKDVYNHKIDLLGLSHRSTLSTLHHLAFLDLRAGYIHEAISAEREVLKHKDKIGPTHQLALSATTVLALAYQRIGHLDQAESLLQQSINLHLRVLGPYNLTTLKTQDLLARLHVQQQKYKRAEKSYLYLIEMIPQVCPDRELHLDKIYELARVQIELGDFEEAERNLEICIREGMAEESYRFDVRCEWLQEMTEPSEEMRRVRGWIERIRSG
ncbi:Kinesin light chain [Pseudocercospora fuligena]|uniref:Kinesin light chain n=1 Tax=Pseudocercospora fuligena TaxID=685502 RepID=A0A8H6RIF1_9PEZI|nr:Kinesin light chain [Pseudocercospora fuligena]